MSTQASESKNDADDEPEEGEIQDDEGSLEDVSSDDEIYPSVKRKERGFYSRTSLPIRSQFAKADAQIIQSARRGMLGTSERIDSKLKKTQIRVKSGYRVMGEQDKYHESMQGHRSSKELNQKISGKIHEKENKGKDAKKPHRSTSYHGNGSELKSAYNSESNFPSASPKGSWRKSDVKEKHKKKRKNSKNNKFFFPLVEVSESQQKTGNDSCSVDEPLISDVNLEGSAMSHIENDEGKVKAELSPSSVSSDIQILDVPVILPEVITICDSDDDLISKKEVGVNNCENIVAKEESTVMKEESDSSQHEIRLEKKDTEKNNIEDSEDHLKFLREAALKSSKPETCSNVNQDDEVLQLRLAALRSAIIRKFEERKKRGLTLSKSNKKSGNQQMMSISPLGSPNYSSSGDSCIRGSSEIDCGSFSPFDFNVTSNQQDATDSINDSEMDKIAAIDMELAESDEERDAVYIDVGEDSFHIAVQEETKSNSINCSRVESEPLNPSLSKLNNTRLIYPTVDTAVTQNCPPSSDFSAHDPSSGLHHVHFPSDGAGHIHMQSGGAYHIHDPSSSAGHVHNPAYNVQHTSPGVTYPLPSHSHASSGGADSIHTSYQSNQIHIPSGGASYNLPSTGYIIGEDEQSLDVEPVLNNSVSPSQHHFSFKLERKIAQNCEESGNVIVEDKIPSSVEANFENSDCEQNSNPVRDSVEMINPSINQNDQSDLSSPSLKASENSITLNVGHTMYDEHGVMISELDQSDHSLSPEYRELDLDSMIVLDEIGESSDDNLPTCHHERVPSIEESNNCSNEDSQSIADDGAENIYEYPATQNISEVNTSSPKRNSINLSENVSTDSGNSAISDENSISFEENCKRFTYNIKSGKFVDTSYKITNSPLKCISAAIQNSSDKPPQESINEFRRDLNKEIYSPAQKVISVDLQDSNDKSSVVNIDGHARQEHEVSDCDKKVISTDSQDSSDGGSYVNVDESSSPEEGEERISQAEKIILANSQNPSSFVDINKPPNQESVVSKHAKKGTSADSQDLSDGSSCVNIDDSTSQEGEISYHTEKTISQDSHNSGERCSYVTNDESLGTNNAKKVISVDSLNSSDKYVPVNISESTRLEASSECNRIFVHNSSNLSDSLSAMKSVDQGNGEMVGKSNAFGNTENPKMSSSNQSDISWSRLTNVKHNSECVLQHELLPACEGSAGSPTQDTEDVEEPEDEDEDSIDDFQSSVDLLLKEPTVISKFTFDDHEIEIVSNAQDGVDQDHETHMLRGSLLEMLNRRSQDDNVDETDLNSDSHESGTCMNESDSVAKNALPSSSPTNTCSEDVSPIGSLKSNDPECDPLVKRTPQSLCATTVPQNPVVPSLPKHASYPSHHSALNKPVIKNRVHEPKVSGRFKINVPKLVINLGEDSDSGEDNESETRPNLASNHNENDASEEQRGNVGSQSVTPDFEKKLDLLLKRARLQQEVTSNDVKEILSQSGNLSESCQKKVVKLRTLNLAGTAKDNEGHSVHSGNSTASSSHVKKVSPLFVQGIRNVHGKNANIRVQTNNKILVCGNNVGVSKTFADRTAVDYHKSVHGKMKNISSSNQPTSSRSSGVDIGLLPSSKQKEYIRLKRQLAQLARKEPEVKTKDAKLKDTTSLSIKRNCVDEIRLLTCADNSVNTLKQITGINCDKTLLSHKFVRRGQGLALVPRTDLGKSRRIVRSVATSGNALPVSQQRLASANLSRIGSASLEGAAGAHHVSGVSSKKITSNSSDVRKKSSAGEVSLVNISEKQQKLGSLPENVSVETTELQKKLSPRVICDKAKGVDQEVQINECVSVNSYQTQKNNSGETVLKRTANHSEHDGTKFRKKIAVEREGTIVERPALTDLENFPQHQIDECRLSINNDMQETCIETNRNLVKRKRTVSEDGRSVRWKPVVLQTSETQTTCSYDSSNQYSKESETFDAKIIEDLRNSESKLISKRYQVLQDIASVQMNLYKIDASKQMKLQIIREIERLKKEMSRAETQLSKEDELLKVLCSEVEDARRGIMKKQSEQLLLSVECEEIGCKIHGSIYSIPNVCTDLIRNGMTQITEALQDLKKEKHLEFDASNPCSSGEIVTEETCSRSDLLENLECQGSEDSNKQIPGSYLSPLDALRATAEPNNDNHAVLCPYQIMGTCKDRECLYQH